MRIKANHVNLFLLGWLYYFVVPLIAASGYFSDLPGIAIFTQYSDQLQSSDLVAILEICVYFLLCFLTGAWLCSQGPKIRVSTRRIPAVLDKLLIFGYILLFIVITYSARASLFRGYSTEDLVDSSSAGPSSTLSLLLTFSCLAAKLSGNLKEFNAYRVLLIANSIILLGMGGRMYVILPLVAFFVAYSVPQPGRSSGISLFRLALVFALILLVGMWRVQTFDFSMIAFFAVAESVLTGVSFMTFYAWNHMPVISIPYEFLSGTINIIPEALFPDKAHFIYDLSSLGYSFESPLGARNVFVSLIANFGVPLSGVFVGCIGAFLSAIYKRREGALYLTLYAYLSGIVPFMFFRDPFQIQVKVVLTAFAMFCLYLTCALYARDKGTSVAASFSPEPA